MNRAAVVVAVKKAGTLPELKAALDGARRFEAWARQEKFETVVTITDENEPVSAKAIRDAIKALVTTDSVEQLFVYFAGHGVNLHFSEYWFLSDAPEDPNEAVNVAGSVQLAKRSGIPHVVFISDACRTAPDGIQLQAINGSYIFPNQPRGGPQKAVDVFFASVLGEPALEIQDKSASSLRYDSLFTSELMAALQGERLTILSPGADKSKVFLRPQPLKRHLMSEVPKLVAAKLGAASEHTQTPDAEILSDEFAFLQAFDATDPRFRPAAAPAISPARTVRSGKRVGESKLTAAQKVLNTAVPGASFIGLVPFESELVEMPCGFRVRGANIVAASAGANGNVELLAAGLAQVHLQHQAASVLIELADGRAVVLPAIRDFVGTLVFEGGALVKVSYEPTDASRRQDFLAQRGYLETLRRLVVSSVHRGELRLERGDAPKLTERIRKLKSLDPTLAVYAAYSYHRLGNLDQIREMEDVLLATLGVSFFDIAMLADRESGSHSQSVPFVPLLAQGWSLLGAFDAETPLLRGLRTHVSSRSLWTVFTASGVERLRAELKGSP